MAVSLMLGSGRGPQSINTVSDSGSEVVVVGSGGKEWTGYFGRELSKTDHQTLEGDNIALLRAMFHQKPIRLLRTSTLEVSSKKRKENKTIYS